MVWIQVVLFSALLAVSWSAEDLCFPPGFMFGAATSAYQVEGGWNAGDKSESTWDQYTHENPEAISDRTNGDVACDSYNLWKRDIEMAEELGLDYYRFSLSWPRILPTGFPNHISEDGKNYYNNLIDGLLAKGIEPFITIYHWDLPQSLQDLGGWTNPLVADWFADYARVVFTLFGDRVKYWLTLNEAIVICDIVYNTGSMAPPIYSPEVGTYICNKNVLLAHAKAWRIYDEEFKPKYHGKVSLATQVAWYLPETPADEELAELARQNCGGRYAHAIFSKQGGWPPSIEKHYEELSKKRGYSRNTLPPFTQEEIDFVRGTFDFFGMNHYTSRMIRKAKEGDVIGYWPFQGAPDLDAVLEPHKDWPKGYAYWFYKYPEGMRELLVWFKKQYGDIEFIITENGYPTGGGLNDQDRVTYYRDYMKQVLLAIKDGVNVTGYTAWTIMDNFEWTGGYNTKFGLYEVDFNDPMRKRTPRASARYYASIIKKHSMDVPLPTA